MTICEEKVQWGPTPDVAIAHLSSRGFKLSTGWCWLAPKGYQPDVKDLSAIGFLIAEWDFGGVYHAV